MSVEVALNVEVSIAFVAIEVQYVRFGNPHICRSFLGSGFCFVVKNFPLLLINDPSQFSFIILLSRLVWTGEALDAQVLGERHVQEQEDKTEEGHDDDIDLGERHELGQQLLPHLRPASVKEGHQGLENVGLDPTKEDQGLGGLLRLEQRLEEGGPGGKDHLVTRNSLTISGDQGDIREVFLANQVSESVRCG